MEHYSLSQQEAGIHIDGFPDAVKVISLKDKRSKRLADLALHKLDLEFADQCLDAINSLPQDSFVIKEALWRSAVIHFIKCFGESGARFQLSPKRTFQGEPKEALLAFRHFKSLRNKHFIHDENSYAQSLTGAILANTTKSYKIEKVVCFSALTDTLSQEFYINLKSLIGKSLQVVIEEFDALTKSIWEELETKSYESLLNMESLQYRVPTSADVHDNR